jgi:isopropylmalate/homocitrate/citramalate synthase
MNNLGLVVARSLTAFEMTETEIEATCGGMG